MQLGESEMRATQHFLAEPVGNLRGSLFLMSLHHRVLGRAMHNALLSFHSLPPKCSAWSKDIFLFLLFRYSPDCYHNFHAPQHLALISDGSKAHQPISKKLVTNHRTRQQGGIVRLHLSICIRKASYSEKTLFLGENQQSPTLRSTG